MLIGLVGKAYSGKDTVADYLVDKWEYKKLSFACHMKDITALMFNWERSLLEGNTEKSRNWREQTDEWWSERLQISNFTPRRALQIVGTDLIRKHLNIKFWIIAMEKKLNSLLESNMNVVISDVRFENEIEMIRKLGGKIIGLNRISDDSKMDQLIASHISENVDWHEKNIDYTIDNNGSKDSLFKKLDKIILI